MRRYVQLFFFGKKWAAIESCQRQTLGDIEILSLKDPNPLLGAGHEHFGFNDWQVPVCFDNLTITPLKS